MFKFTIRELLEVMLFCALATWAAVLLGRYMEAPLLSGVAAGEVVAFTAIGMLLGKFRGAIIGMALGFVAGLLTLAIGYWRLFEVWLGL